MKKFNLKLLLANDIELRKMFDNDAVKTVSAFANTSGGICIIGMESSEKVEGIAVSENTVEIWTDLIKSKTQLAVDIVIEEIDSKKIAVIYVDEDINKPISFDGRYYERVNNLNHRMNLNEIINMFNKF